MTAEAPLDHTIRYLHGEESSAAALLRLKQPRKMMIALWKNCYNHHVSGTGESVPVSLGVGVMSTSEGVDLFLP